MASPVFRPPDIDLLSRYLRPRRDGLPLPEDSPFYDTDVYRHHPQELAEAHAPRDGAYYFFTVRTKQRRPSGFVHVVDRNVYYGVGTGKWNASGRAKEIRDGRGEIIGTRRDLRFEPKDEADWYLEEFFLHPQDDGQPRVWDEVAAYRLYRQMMRSSFRGQRSG